jgi:hypothetical protein
VNKITPTELLEMFDPTVRDRIRANYAKPGVTALVVYENQMFDSSQFGARSALIVGPTCTIQTVEEAAKHRMHTELASTQQIAVAYCEKEI